jgi:hypothetical protein
MNGTGMKKQIMEGVQFCGTRWAQDLEAYSQAFAKEISSIKNWDAQVLTNRMELERLQANLAVSFAEYCRVTRQLDILEQHQKKVGEVLVSLSSDMTKEETLLLPSSNDRGLLFTFGEEVSSKLKAIAQMFPGGMLEDSRTQEEYDCISSPLFNLLKLNLRELQRLEQKLNALAKKHISIV